MERLLREEEEGHEFIFQYWGLREPHRMLWAELVCDQGMDPGDAYNICR